MFRVGEPKRTMSRLYSFQSTKIIGSYDWYPFRNLYVLLDPHVDVGLHYSLVLHTHTKGVDLIVEILPSTCWLLICLNLRSLD